MKTTFIEDMLLGREIIDYPNTDSKFNKNKKRLKEVIFDYPLAIKDQIIDTNKYLRFLFWFSIPYLVILLLGIIVFLTSIVLVPVIITIIHKKAPKWI